MSKAPPPKQNPLQTVLFMVILYMMYMLWTTSQQQKSTVVVTADQHYANLLKMDEERQDVSIVREKSAYDSAIDDLVKQKKLTPAEAEEKKVQSSILVADTQLKAGVHSGDSGRLRDAYNMLQPLEKQYLDKPIWNTSFPVPSSKQFAWNSWTGQALYTDIVDKLTESNKHELVYGFIPGYQIMDFLVHVTGGVPWYSYALAGFLLALSVRAIVYPLMQKQLMFSRQMGQLSPLVREIKEQFPKPEDAAEVQKRTMKLYKEYGINPFQGCFPALIQMPLFLTVYQCMLRYQFAFQKGTFLWINKATSLNTHGFVAPNLGQADYILILIYGVTMLISTLLTPASDPSQVKQQRLMSVGISVMFTVFMFTGKFPVVSGFVLYWVFTNVLSMTQSLRAYRLPLPPLVKVNAEGGGVYPKPSKFAQWMEEAQRRATEEQQKSSGANSASAKWLKPATEPDDDAPGATAPKNKPRKRK